MSAPFRLSQADARKIVKGAVVAAGGVVVAMILAGGAVVVHIIAPDTLSATAVGAVLAAVGAVLLNATRKWLLGSDL